MISAKRIDRKLFLTLGLTTTSAWAIGCSDDAVDAPLGGSGSGGAGGTGTAGAGGSTSTAGTFASTSGSSTGGSGGSAAGSGGSAAGTGGSSAGSGGSGGSGGSSAPAPNCSTQLKTLITANHEHVFNVTVADVMAMAPKTYSTKGGSPHEHWVALTAADFAKLQAGGTVHKVSCNDGHEHEFIVNCVGIAMPETTSGVANFCDAEHKCGDLETDVCPIIP
ncbi:MAG TPA: hypothetical protein VHP33_07705 [Polyangiaceae bacterium]|nr:hypothetical protein [Polyangiaceae bacterium]